MRIANPILDYRSEMILYLLGISRDIDRSPLLFTEDSPPNPHLPPVKPELQTK